MKIHVKIFATLRLKLGVSDFTIECDQTITMLELLELASKKLNADIILELLEDGEIRVGTILLINGKDVLHADKLQTIISEDCEVSIFPPVGGG